MPRLAAGTAAEANGASLRVFPSLAEVGEPVRAALPTGAGAGQMRVHDALGRVVGTRAVPVGTPQVLLPVVGLAQGLYLVEFVPARSEQPRAAARLLLH